MPCSGATDHILSIAYPISARQPSNSRVSRRESPSGIQRVKNNDLVGGLGLGYGILRNLAFRETPQPCNLNPQAVAHNHHPSQLSTLDSQPRTLNPASELACLLMSEIPL